MSVVANHDLGAGAVIREKDHQRVFPLTHLSDLIADPADFDIHAMNHGRVNRHLRGLKLLLLCGEVLPGKWTVNLARAKNFERFRKMVRWAEVTFDCRKFFHTCRVKQPQLFHALPAFLPDGFPASSVRVPVNRDVFGKRVQRKMRSRERQVMKERRGLVLFLMLGQHLDRVIGQSRRGIKVGAFLDGR